MVGFYVNLKIKAGFEAKFEEILKEIVPASRKDKGCISYECGKVVGTQREYCFIELGKFRKPKRAYEERSHGEKCGCTRGLAKRAKS